ncbi:hypothetical protein MF672_027260 [Actinomadura sp. ATCC 31491]|uniref:DUF3040 domain-containing protein n=1 Tax=Actinomadura luzonensis TaxID=2805427 RepID=A0ABT0FYN3_9ACTN|nr:hypothetical protein [Actinomadura luzonensis]MCK2217460.1 hypothetical protein [Actinomadura luzonensis]
MSTGDELKAAMSARRELGPDFEDAIVESFLDKMGKEVDRRVDERLAQAAPRPAAQQRAADGQRLALAIVSLCLGTISTLALVFAGEQRMGYLIPIWVGIIIVNAVFNGPRGKG